MAELSVIMGVYNCKNTRLLELSVESVMNQTYQDWEFIICNDGSTDSTLEKLKKFEEMDKRIKIISYKKNRGLNYALNQCLKIAQGTFIARQDDDDISYPTRFEKEILFLKKNPQYALVGTIADVYDDSGIWGEYHVDEKPSKKSFLWNSPFMHPTIMVRKSAYNKVQGYRIARETRRCEDLDLFMRMYAEGFKGYNIQQKLYKYRISNELKIKKRPMKYRIDEAVVRYKGYKALGILIPSLPFIFKPVFIGIIPQKVQYKIVQKKYKERIVEKK